MRPFDLLEIITLALVLGTSTVGMGFADETGWVPITGPVEITQPGSYYLAGDIPGCGAEVCINISCNDVVLDGREHQVLGTSSDGTTGILASVPPGSMNANITVCNFSIGGFAAGISFERVHGGTIRENTLSGNGRGINLLETDDVLVTGNNASY